MAVILSRPRWVNLTACCWLCTAMVALVCRIVCTRSGCTCWHLIVARSSKCVSDIRLKWKMKLWTVTRVIMWLLCDHGVEWSKDWVFSHISSIYWTIRCRCRAQTYTPLRSSDVTLLTQACWAIRLWISGRGLTMCSKCHTCMPVCKMYNPCTIKFNAPALWKTSQVWASSVARHERPSMFFNFTKIILVTISISN